MGIIDFLAVGIVLVIYAILSYYIGFKGVRFLKAFEVKIHFLIYWVLFWAISLSFFAAQIFRGVLPAAVKNPLNFIGSFWLAAMLYLLMLLLVFEIVYFICRKRGIWERYAISRETVTKAAGSVILVCLITILSVGFINADLPIVRTYQIDMPKKAGALNELNVVMLSDIHIGSPGHSGLMKKAVDQINSLNPDIVLFAGDVIDNKIEPFISGNYGEYFKQIKSKYGLYAITGNHEYYGGDSEEFIKQIRAAGVNLLLDQNVKIADSFNLVGRIDKTGSVYTKINRKTVPELMENVDRNLPVILMDHQPMNLENAADAGVDLQFSGHTHKGQIFPGNIITKYSYEINWGYLKKGAYQIIVSSGLGTWGPPIRLGSQSEIVNVKITFK